jgi:hypothetical protein
LIANHFFLDSFFWRDEKDFAVFPIESCLNVREFIMFDEQTTFYVFRGFYGATLACQKGTLNPLICPPSLLILSLSYRSVEGSYGIQFRQRFHCFGVVIFSSEVFAT